MRIRLAIRSNGYAPERRCARIDVLAQAVLRKARAYLTLDRTAESAGVS